MIYNNNLYMIVSPLKLLKITDLLYTLPTMAWSNVLIQWFNIDSSQCVSTQLAQQLFKTTKVCGRRNLGLTTV